MAGIGQVDVPAVKFDPCAAMSRMLAPDVGMVPVFAGCFPFCRSPFAVADQCLQVRVTIIG